MMLKSSENRRLRKLVDEEWKEIPQSSGIYYISNYGRVKSFKYDKVNGQILKPYLLKGYFSVGIKNVPCSKYIHRLVAENWLEKPTLQHTHVIHIDGNKKNNYFKNLAWATNEQVKERSATFMREKNKKLSTKERITYSKLNENDVKLIKSMLRRGITQNIIAKLFKISEMQVTRIKRGENWGFVTDNEENTNLVN
jgi:hypothetical protein